MKTINVEGKSSREIAEEFVRDEEINIRIGGTAIPIDLRRTDNTSYLMTKDILNELTALLAAVYEAGFERGEWQAQNRWSDEE